MQIQLKESEVSNIYNRAFFRKKSVGLALRVNRLQIYWRKYKQKIPFVSKLTMYFIQLLWQSGTTYSSGTDWSTLDFFCLLTSPTCCNLPRKSTPAKYKGRQKAGFPIVTGTHSFPRKEKRGPFFFFFFFFWYHFPCLKKYLQSFNPIRTWLFWSHVTPGVWAF